MLNAIFDFNGTMFFDETFQEKAWQQYMTEKLGRRITPEEFQTWVHGRNTGDTLEYFFGRPFTQQEADEEEEAEETIYRALCRQSPDYKLADGLVEFLDFKGLPYISLDHTDPVQVFLDHTVKYVVPFKHSLKVGMGLNHNEKKP